jgi:hypothetical protein
MYQWRGGLRTDEKMGLVDMWAEEQWKGGLRSSGIMERLIENQWRD